MRFNITLPADIGSQLKKRPNRSAFVAQSLKEKLAAEDKKELNKLLEEGYRACAEEDRLLAKEWESTLADGL